MSVSLKSRRKICCCGNEYVWYISQQECDVLNIISMDKKLILAVPMRVVTPYVICKGVEFQNYTNKGSWQRYLCPHKPVSSITPKFVALIIHWAVEEKNAISVEWNGLDIFL